jgi:arsenate reductase
MNKVTIYHNPRCSKSRQTLELLEKENIDIEVIKYLETPPSSKVLDKVLTFLEKDPRELMRKNEKEYNENDMANEKLSRSELIALMHKYPKVIERPIVISGDKAAIGRPPESVLDIL